MSMTTSQPNISAIDAALAIAARIAFNSVMITSVQPDKVGTPIVYVNAAFTQLTGYTAEEVMGKTPAILQGPKTDQAVLHRLRENLSRGEGFHGLAINYRKDGSEFLMEWKIAPLRNDQGQITHFVAVQREAPMREAVL